MFGLELVFLQNTPFRDTISIAIGDVLERKALRDALRSG